MRLIIGWCLGNRPVVLLFALIAMGAGLVSVFRLNQEFLPSVEFPTVFILTTEPGFTWFATPAPYGQVGPGLHPRPTVHTGAQQVVLGVRQTGINAERKA